MSNTAALSDPAVPQPEEASFEERRRRRVEARLGSVVAGRYALVRVLGHGGMGAVYEAEHLALGRRVAIKLMLGDDALDKTTVARFVREAKAAARIAHPNIVAVLDADHDAQARTPYIAQELLTGTDLRGHLADRGKLDAREALTLLVPILDALDAAHRAGVIHRDLKPENIFLAVGESGRTVPKLIDFGVSKLLDAHAPGVALTRTGGLVGTPRYMPPEQARGLREVDASADVWSLGVVLFETLAGRMPFRADNYNALMVEILTAEIPSVRAAAPETPPWLADVVAQMLHRDRDLRLPDAGAVLRALRSVTDAPPWLTALLAACSTRLDASPSVPVAARTSAASSLAVADTLVSDAPPAPPITPSRAPRLVVATVALGALVTALAARSPSPTRPAETPSRQPSARPTPPPAAAPSPPPHVAPTPPPPRVEVAAPRVAPTPRTTPRRPVASPRALDAGATLARPAAPHVVAPVTDPEHMQ